MQSVTDSARSHTALRVESVEQRRNSSDDASLRPPTVPPHRSPTCGPAAYLYHNSGFPTPSHSGTTEALPVASPVAPGLDPSLRFVPGCGRSTKPIRCVCGER